MSARGEPLGDAAVVDAVLADFDLGRALELRGLGGTAARKWAVRAAPTSSPIPAVWASIMR